MDVVVDFVRPYIIYCILLHVRQKASKGVCEGTKCGESHHGTNGLNSSLPLLSYSMGLQ